MLSLLSCHQDSDDILPAPGRRATTLKFVHEYPPGADILVDEEQLFPLLHDSQQTLSASALISLDNFRV